jgi:ABC-type antimicrobial peptide transport system permease subunit
LTVGLAAGLILSTIANRVLARWSIGNLSDPGVLATVALLFLVASIAAVADPVIRALAVQPSEVLRTD